MLIAIELSQTTQTYNNTVQPQLKSQIHLPLNSYPYHLVPGIIDLTSIPNACFTNLKSETRSYPNCPHILYCGPPAASAERAPAALVHADTALYIFRGESPDAFRLSLSLSAGIVLRALAVSLNFQIASGGAQISRDPLLQR